MSRTRPPLGRFARALLGVAGRGGRLRPFLLWPHWESLAMRVWRVRPVRPEAVLQFGLSPYRGAGTTLADGTAVRTGDPILHLHLDNRRLGRLRATEGWRSWRLARLLAMDLDELAQRVAHGELGEVRALRGVSVFAGAATRLGFEVRPLPRNLASAAVRQISALVIAAYDPGGLESLRRGVPWPGEIWMSRRTLLSRVGRNPSGAGSAHGRSGIVSRVDQ